MSNNKELTDFINDLQKSSVLIGTPSEICFNDDNPVYVVSRKPKYIITQLINSSTMPVFTLENNLSTSVRMDKESPEYSIHFVAYPRKIEHAQLFAQSQTKDCGPNTFFPGSIAISEMYHNPKRQQVEIGYLQFSFKQGHPKQITRSIASKYMGARNELLREKLRYISRFENTAITFEPDFSHGKNNQSYYDQLIQSEEFAHLFNKK